MGIRASSPYGHRDLPDSPITWHSSLLLALQLPNTWTRHLLPRFQTLLQEDPPSPLCQANSHPSFESSALVVPPSPPAPPLTRDRAGTPFSLAPDPPARALLQHRPHHTGIVIFLCVRLPHRRRAPLGQEQRVPSVYLRCLLAQRLACGVNEWWVTASKHTPTGLPSRVLPLTSPHSGTHFPGQATCHSAKPAGPWSPTLPFVQQPRTPNSLRLTFVAAAHPGNPEMGWGFGPFQEEGNLKGVPPLATRNQDLPCCCLPPAHPAHPLSRLCPPSYPFTLTSVTLLFPWQVVSTYCSLNS